MPTEQKTIRKLRAILSADVKGYSLLMADDEAFTIRTLKEYRSIMSAQIEQHNGRVVDSPGDNVLAEFASAVDAVTCAVEIQKVLKEKNDELPDDKKLEFRIGINIGDVVQDEDRIYGSGVNVAARIEGLAEPGGVSISRSAYDQIKDKITLGYEYIGQHDVKNISEPVRVYKILMGPEDAGKLIGEEPTRVRKKWVLPLVIVAAIIVTSFAWYFYQNIVKPDVEPASIENMAFPLPDKPSIAVLPFDNMSGDSEQEYFCDGLTEEIITALSKVPKLFVIARNSTFTYKGKPVKVQQVSEELGVRYVLEGSVRKVDNRLRITAQLIDAIKGHHLWSERYDRELKDILAVQDEITMKIITDMGVKLTTGEQARVSAKGTANLDAYLKCLEAREYIFRLNRDSNLIARQRAEEAITLDPEYSIAYSLLSNTHILDVWFKWSKSPKESMMRAFELARKALALDESNSGAHLVFAKIFLLQRLHDKAIAEGERAVSLAPNAADAINILGLILRFAGRPQEAATMHERAIRLNPMPPAQYFYQLALCYTFIGEYQKAIAICKEALKKNPDDFVGRITLTIAYSALGSETEAKAEAEEALRISPKFTVAYAEKTWPYKNTADKEFVISALRKAGLPDKPPLALPDKPSIAVLPFTNMSGDPEQEYFSDGLTEEIITAFSKVPGIFVIARNSTFTYKGKPVKVQQVAEDLGVRYVLEGSVRKGKDKVRITTQLIDALTGHHLWAERYDRNLKDIFAVQDEITKNIITALQVKLTAGETALVLSKGTENLQAYLKYWQAAEKFHAMTKEGNSSARRLAKEAVTLDPKFPATYVLLGWTHTNDVMFGASKSPKKSFAKAMELAKKAIAIDDSYFGAHALLGWIYIKIRKHEKAIAECERAVALAPNSAFSIVWMSIALRYAGRHEEAVGLAEQAIRLNPMPSSFLFQNLGITYMFTGRYEEAIGNFKKALNLAPNALVTHVNIAVAYIKAGQEDEARAAVAEVIRINPKISLLEMAKLVNYKNQADNDMYIDALRRAGLPEHPPSQ